MPCRVAFFYLHVAIGKNYAFPCILDLNLILESTFNHYIIYILYIYFYVYSICVSNYVLTLRATRLKLKTCVLAINYLKYVLSARVTF